MDIQDNELNNPYLQNDDLWGNWREGGVTDSTSLNVEFQFISNKKESAKKFTEYMKKLNFQVYMDKCENYWDIVLTTPQQTWTLEKLNQQAKELSEIASNYGCCIDGIGAMLPKL
jgi:hypothetical protein